ncbi:MAG: hypothetical protein GY841_15485 [FCB group bacterium]|nr:hypothetical protein [FCB group bacterium]
MSHDTDPLRTECAVKFAKSDTIVEGFTEAIKEFRKSRLESEKRLTAVEASTKSAWHELRNDVIPDLKQIPEQVRTELKQIRNEISDAMVQHKNDCPAYANAMDRARRHIKTTPPSGSFRKPKSDEKFFTNTRLKWLVYLGFIFGGAIAGAGVTLGYWQGVPELPEVSESK